MKFGWILVWFWVGIIIITFNEPFGWLYFGLSILIYSTLKLASSRAF